MSSEEKKIIEFVVRLPPDVNPYGAVAQHMKELMTKSTVSQNSSTFSIYPAAANGYLGDCGTALRRDLARSHQPATTQTKETPIDLDLLCDPYFDTRMFLQAVHLIYARISAGAFKLWIFTRLGLYHVDIASTAGLTYMVYSICQYHSSIVAIVDLVILDFCNAGKRDLSGELVLFGCKYIIIVGNACFSMGVCLPVCNFNLRIRIRGDVWHGKETPSSNQGCYEYIIVDGTRPSNPSYLVLLSNLVALVVHYYTRLDQEYGMAKMILHDVLKGLSTKAATVTPQNYSRMALLAMLTPARGMQPHAKNMARFTRMGITVYLVELTILSVLYVPLLAFSLSRLYARSVSQKQLSQAASGGEGSEKISSMGRKIREQRTRLVTHAIMSYLSYKGDGFLLDKTWLTLTRVIQEADHMSTFLRIAFILNLHARNQLIEIRNQSPPSSTMNPSYSGSRNKETSLPKYTAILRGRENVALSVLPTHINQTLSSTSKSISQKSSVNFKETFNNCPNDQKSEMSAEESIAKN
ncbi:uncharacterized protein MELLADRAFT_63639 [Melampsora larici-populina 98AG31]|uniref:Uncharacterized protein n=1 Tax=Melampsora larici-populina (strain 98AG31 / pathotype 3-4-7) TaxID=747676 RepID=F4RNF2_MELLP|nr:uncharacterized protein MELLADRAFT_63639 [Melampsora larici-populina 98AG31]EGG06107.1 hypothetical protein MELLADRAFT_63639 [Melampsora larici-populina 98AG31]